jgi:hypothetical protein
VSQSGDLDGHERWDFSKGEQIENWRSSAWIKSKSPEEDAPPDDGLVNHLAVLIFSSRMRLTMEGAGILGIQHLAIRVFKSDGCEYPGYSIANILNLRSSRDYDRSDFSVFPEDYFWATDRGRISSLRTAVLKRSTLQDLDILRLEGFRHAVFVSRRFVDLYTNHCFTGYSFQRTEVSES